MKKFLSLLLLCFFVLNAEAQQTTPGYQSYGKVDKADLEMKSCDFEPDANAEVLFDKADIQFEMTASFKINMVEERHIRIKIFNDKAKEWANIKIRYLGGTNLEHINDLEAETISMADGKIQIIKLDTKQLYKQVIDKYNYEMVFSMPEVKPGCIIEYKYKYVSAINFPYWFFQDVIPVRYSELNTIIPSAIRFNEQINTQQPFVKHLKYNDIANLGWQNTDVQKEQYIMEKIPSLPIEPKMTSLRDNLESVKYISFGAYSNTWTSAGKSLINNEDFGFQVNKNLSDEEAIKTKTEKLTTENNKIEYLFDFVRDEMKWNGIDNIYTNDGINTAWNKKVGNSTEINLILYNLLKKCGIKCSPMLVSTRKNGRINPIYAFLGQFNRTVVFVPLNADATNYLILDATGKYNSYIDIPEDLLNASGLCIDLENKSFNIEPIENGYPIRKVVVINAEISPDAKMTGTADISNYSYNRTKDLDIYKTTDKENFIAYLKGDNNSINISDLKVDNMTDDTLPLSETFNFKMDLTGSDENYIFLNSNLFSTLKNNPFINPTRKTDIDFGYRDNYSITAQYKIPSGYKVDALPKSITSIMPDTSIVFKRIVAEDDGTIVVRYNIDHRKSFYFKENYADFLQFYRKMYELLNEQIVLKKL